MNKRRIVAMFERYTEWLREKFISHAGSSVKKQAVRVEVENDHDRVLKGKPNGKVR